MQGKQSLFRTATFAAVFGLWTALTLSGSVWAFLFTAGPNSITRLDVIRSSNTSLQLTVALSIYLCGGGLWGLGIARWMNADAKSMVKACALSWSATGFAFGMVLAIGLALGLVSKTIRILPDCCHSTHYFFLSVFVPVIGIVTGLNAYVVIGKLGFAELKRSAGMCAGLVGALGFLAVGLILLYGFGWEVGHPVIGKYGMLKLALLCSMGAALAGGTAIGWMLEKARNVTLT